MNYSTILKSLHQQALLNPILRSSCVGVESYQGITHEQIFAQIYTQIKEKIEALKKTDQILFQDLEEQKQLKMTAERQQKGNNEIGEEQQSEEEYQDQDSMDAQDQYMQDQEGEGKEEDEEGGDYEQEQEGEQDEDVGLYGEALDEQDMDNYEYEDADGEDVAMLQQEQDLQDAQDEEIENQFDHFREVQIENQQQEEQGDEEDIRRNKEIEELERKRLGKKEWMMQGEVSARQRPVNSLLQQDLDFKSNIKHNQDITQEHNEGLEDVIRKRILGELFDDRTRFIAPSRIQEAVRSMSISTQKNQHSLAELYELDFNNHLGLEDRKADLKKKLILQEYKQLCYQLDSLSNFSHVLDGQRGSLNQQLISREERIPLTFLQQHQSAELRGKASLESRKEVDKKAHRLKNKRIARQRKKEEVKRKMNKNIEYGGITKAEAKATLKALSNRNRGKNEVLKDYSKSKGVFEQLNEKKSGRKTGGVSLNKYKM